MKTINDVYQLGKSAIAAVNGILWYDTALFVTD